MGSWGRLTCMRKKYLTTRRKYAVNSDAYPAILEL